MPPPLNVLVVTSTRDAEHAIRPEAELLLGLFRAGVRLEVMTQGDSLWAQRFREAGLPVHPYHPTRKLSLGAMRRIRRTLVEGGHHILHLFNNKAIANGVWAAQGLPVRVLTYRGVVGNLPWYDPSSYLTHLHPRVDHIVAVSEAVKSYLQRQLWWNPRKITRIYKGHDPSWYADIQPLDIRAERGLPPETLLVGCAVNHRKGKGLPTLLEAWKRLPPRPHTHLLLMGHHTEPLRKLLRGHPAESTVHFLGYRPDLLRILPALDLYVHPSHSEGLSKAILEAMALGCPCCVAAAAGNDELVLHGKTGLCFPPRNPAALTEALQHLLDAPQKRRIFAAEARRHFEQNFSLQTAVAQTLQLYRRLLRGA
ncbi:MAG: glycosyltransferase family 1 protein [Bacteroidetes bacterium]|nr:MAG: glycosyltransferase family 1 protein [Bacteroidota bacterium]